MPGSPAAAPSQARPWPISSARRAAAAVCPEASMPRVFFTRAAREDLIDIWTHIAEDDPSAADHHPRGLCQAHGDGGILKSPGFRKNFGAGKFFLNQIRFRGSYIQMHRKQGARLPGNADDLRRYGADELRQRPHEDAPHGRRGSGRVRLAPVRPRMGSGPGKGPRAPPEPVPRG